MLICLFISVIAEYLTNLIYGKGVLYYKLTWKTCLVSFKLVCGRKFDLPFTHSLKNFACFHFCSKLILLSKPVKASLRNHVPCFIITDTKKAIIEITKKYNHVCFWQLRFCIIRLRSCGLLLPSYCHTSLRESLFEKTYSKIMRYSTYIYSAMQLDRCSTSCTTYNKHEYIMVKLQSLYMSAWIDMFLHM